MTKTIKHSLWFSLGVMLALLCWEALTFPLPPDAASEAWMQNLILHASVIVVLTLSNLAGSVLGFYFFPAGRSIRRPSLMAIGAVYAILAAVAAPIIFISMGVEFAVRCALVLAALCSYFGGRLLSRNEIAI